MLPASNVWSLLIRNYRGMGVDGGMKVADALKSVATSLSNWSTNVLGDLEKSMKRLKKDLEMCRRGVRSKSN